MKKAILRALSIVLVLALCFSVAIFASAAAAGYYEDMDLSETSASSHVFNNTNQSAISIVDDAVEGHGKSVKITSINRTTAADRNKTSRIRLYDSAGGQLYLKALTDYRISFDMNVVSTTAPILVGYKRNNASTFTNDASNNLTGTGLVTIAKDDAVIGGGYKRYSFEFNNGSTSTNMRLLLCFYTSNNGSTSYGCEIYIDNIVIEEKVAITYSGDADSTGLPTTAWAAQTYEEVLGDAAGDWYLDAECTTAASGIINSDAVTLYAKEETVEPSYGVETPEEAALFVTGQDTSTNAGIEGGTENSAVYEVSGKKYVAFRVFGTYVAPAKADGSGADYGKVVVDANGTTKDIVSRHVILGYNNNEPTVDNNYAKSTVTASFENCWNTEINADGTYTVTYSLLLKDIPQDYVDTAFTVRSAVVTAEETIYSSEVQENVSAQGIYDSAINAGYIVGWFE